MKDNNIKEKKGVTLIILVVTMIIFFILMSITFASVIQSGKLMNTTVEIKNKQKEVTDKEENIAYIRSSILEAQLNNSDKVNEISEMIHNRELENKINQKIQELLPMIKIRNSRENIILIKDNKSVEVDITGAEIYELIEHK